MSEHFCGSCNRLRLTADGNLKVRSIVIFKLLNVSYHHDCQLIAKEILNCSVDTKDLEVEKLGILPSTMKAIYCHSV